MVSTACLGLLWCRYRPNHHDLPGLHYLSRSPVGTGPFKLVRWEPGKEIVLEANDRYYEGRPFLDSVIVKIGGTSEEMFAEFLQGKLEETLIPSARTEEARIDPRYH